MKILGNLRPSPTRLDLPLLAVKEILFPHMVNPFFADKDMGQKAIEIALSEKQEILLFPSTSHDPYSKAPTMAIMVYILQTLKLPDGSIRVLVEGRQRVKVKKVQKKGDYYRAEAEGLVVPHEVKGEIPALVHMILGTLRTFKDFTNKMPKEKASALFETESPDKLIDLIVPHLTLSEEKRLFFFWEEKVAVRLENLAICLQMEQELASLQGEIHKKVKARMEQTQKEYFLNEQIKEINKELGHDDGDATGAAELKAKIQALECPEEVKEKALKECGRLSKLQGTSPEAGILRNYLEWIVELPWSKKTQDTLGIGSAKEILDADHYDMAKAKERILDFIAVRQVQDRLKGPILCLVGPPGTGKTSLGRSVARSLGRDFIRISLGGVRDEAEIRGHRKTYVGALPGKIIQSMKKAQSTNPVFLLDEIDKMSSDFRGDPASALLEVLDPEQNSTFMDHYLEVPYNLSDVMFITTANSLHNIPRPLLDRMEIIEIPGYTDFEKVQIAKKFIIPKQKEENGLGNLDVVFEESALIRIIHKYTSESGVRGLERNIGQVMRKLVRKILELELTPSQIKESPELEQTHAPLFKVLDSQIKEYLGNKEIFREDFTSHLRPGMANGLAWTEVGGKVLLVEVTFFKGKGELILTGSLGDVMKESARIALSFLKARGSTWNISPESMETVDLHIHFPEGSIPKDGPSAGITVTAALASSFSNRPIRKNIAMTGEVTLTGRILPIGGVKEKVLAAFRHGITNILLPLANERDLEEIPQEIRTQMEFFFASTIEEAFAILFPEDKS